MTGHTPAPWTVQNTIKGRYVRRAKGSLGDAAICKVLKVPASSHHRPGGPGLLEREQEADANARVLAAAPDLLAACELFTGSRARGAGGPEPQRLCLSRLDRVRGRASATRDREGDRHLSGCAHDCTPCQQGLTLETI